MDWDDLRKTRDIGQMAARGLSTIARALPMLENSSFQGGGVLTGNIQGKLSWVTASGDKWNQVPAVKSWTVSENLKINVDENLNIRGFRVDFEDLQDWFVWLNFHHSDKQLDV